LTRTRDSPSHVSLTRCQVQITELDMKELSSEAHDTIVLLALMATVLLAGWS
jgi:hypothetical protein